MKKVLLLIASPRKGSNSDILADAVREEVRNRGAVTKKIYITDLKINPCKGCLRCNLLGRCVQKDGFASFLKKFTDAHVIVISSPVYFHSIPGPLKTVLDRFRSVIHVTVRKNKLLCETTLPGRKDFLIILVQGEPTADDYKPAYQLLKTFSKRVARARKVLLLVAKGLPMKGQVKMNFDSLKSLFKKLALPTNDRFVSERMCHNRKLIQKARTLAASLIR
jgi:multimeric flavodoxin WrbA